MALGESRQVFETIVDQKVSGVSERGGIMSYVPYAVGLVAYANAAAISGALVNPAGLMLGDIEALNYWLHPEYRQRNVDPQGSVVALASEGQFFTDFVETTLAGITVGTYAPGDVLYLADDGKVSRNNGTFGNAGTAIRKVVGKALDSLGSDGFLKVDINL